MKLSIVIVNYNVQYFLEQCLGSVENAIKSIEAEVIVVDNNSIDDSVQMLEKKFPWVKVIASKENLGFSKGNNRAITQAQGEYVLLLNPDTLVEEDTFTKCIDFMDHHKEAGGLGVKMMDGKGNFLPESKRSLPTPAVAFYKIFGLSSLFPKSKTFGRYHLGHLSDDATHEVEILSGAFMLLRKKAIDQVGMLDESFFMYGEDIDLSYRLIQGGWKNYYFSDTRIIHYKGESTKKSSVNYVFVFYNAMIIFAKKHFSNQNAFLFSFLIKIAIYFRASLAIARRFLEKLLFPITDFIIGFGGFYLIKTFWETRLKNSKNFYPSLFLQYEIPIFIGIILLFVALNKGYRHPFNLNKTIKGLSFGVITVLLGYSFLSEEYRFSRGIVLIGSLWTMLSIILSRNIAHYFKHGKLSIDPSHRKRIAIIGSPDEINRVSSIMHQSHFEPKFFGKVSPNENREKDFIGTINQVEEIINIHKINEIIFCSKNLSARQIMSTMEKTKQLDIDFKIAPESSLFIIGSNSIDSPGELYLIDINSLNKKTNQRTKRIFDVIAALVLMLFSPILMWVFSKPKKYFGNLFSVIRGERTWVGYTANFDRDNKMPLLKRGILSPIDAFDHQIVSNEIIRSSNIKYVNDYKVEDDINILIRGLKKLDR